MNGRTGGYQIPLTIDLLVRFIQSQFSTSSCDRGNSEFNFFFVAVGLCHDSASVFTAVIASQHNSRSPGFPDKNGAPDPLKYCRREKFVGILYAYKVILYITIVITSVRPRNGV